MIKAHYDQETNLVKGYYPDNINYKTIPEPYIEIENKDQVLGKKMCVVDNVYQEYVAPESEKLEQLKNSKISTCKSYLDRTDWKPIREIDVPDSYQEADKQLRILARIAINDLEELTTLEEIQNYDISKFE